MKVSHTLTSNVEQIEGESNISQARRENLSNTDGEKVFNNWFFHLNKFKIC